VGKGMGVLDELRSDMDLDLDLEVVGLKPVKGMEVEEVEAVWFGVREGVEVTGLIRVMIMMG